MAERLLVAQDLDPPRLSLRDKLGQLLGTQRTVRRTDERVLLEGILVFHIVREHIQLQFRSQVKLALERLGPRARARG